MNAIDTLVKKIEAELDRLDAYDDGQGGIVCAAEPNLPEGWVRVYDGYGNAWGKAEDILAALQAVEYDPEEIVRTEDKWVVCLDPNCPYWTWAEPDANSPHAHGHSSPVEVTARNDCLGFELAWDALGEFDAEPTDSQTWPAELFTVEKLDDDGDTPTSLITLKTNAGTRYVAGPHGFTNCAIQDWFDDGLELSESREEAIELGSEMEADDE